MGYCTKDDILLKIDEATLIQLTDDAGTGLVDDAAVARAIADADEEVDAYLSARYSLPFSSTPDRVRTLSVDIACYRLYGRRTAIERPESIKDDYTAAIRFLDKVVKHQADLDVPDPANDSDAGIGVSTVKSDRVFSRGRSSDSTSGSLDNY